MNRIVFTRRMFSNLLCILTFCLPMFRYYNFLSTGLGMETIMTLLMLAICLVMFFMGINRTHKIFRTVRKSQIWFGLMIFWLLMITCIYELFTEINIGHSEAEYTIISLIMIVIRAVVIGYLLGGDFDYREIFKIYSILVTAIVSVYLLQWLMMLAGIRLSFKMPLMPFSNAYSYLNEQTYFGMENMPTSFFSEKAHLCEFLVPYIAVCLFGNNIIKSRNILKAVLVSAVVVSTVSGTGLVVVMIVWLLYFGGMGQKKSKYRFIYLLAGVSVMVILFLLVSQIPTFEDMLNRLFVDTSGEEYSSTKADYRIYRGFDLFSQLPIQGQIFGIGYNHMQLYASIHKIVSEYDNPDLAYEFFSTVFQIAIYSGFIGITLAVGHIYRLFKAKSSLAKALIIIMLAMWCSSAMFLNNSHIMLIMLIVSAVYYDNKPSEAHA